MSLPYVTDMRRDVQEIFKAGPNRKQVMMFSATLSQEMKVVCRKFMKNVSRPCHKPLLKHK